MFRLKSISALFMISFIAFGIANVDAQTDEMRKQYMKERENWLQKLPLPKEYKIKSDDDQVTQLLKKRINAALWELNSTRDAYRVGREVFERMAMAHKRLLDAKLEFHTDPDEIIDALEVALSYAEEMEMQVHARHKEGTVSVQDRARAAYLRLDAEVRLMQAKKKFDRAKGSAK